MDSRDILSKCDHTLLAVTSTWEEIKAVIDDGVKYHTASVCIPPCFVKEAKEYAGDKIAICTVIGFPNGYNSTAVKVYETKDAVKNGADEIDMVVNIGDVKAHNYEKVLAEIRSIRRACRGKVLKVIVETCLLTKEEKAEITKIVRRSRADFIKTSTGFSTAGATKEDVKIFKRHAGKNLKIKAAGGISSLKDAEDFIALGASRLGTSRIVKIVKEENLL